MTLRLTLALLLSCVIPAFAGQAPGTANSPDIAVSHRDRFYTSDQFSNTVSVIDPADNKVLGAIRLGDPTPGNLSPLYRGQLLVHGMGFSPDHRTLAAVSVCSSFSPETVVITTSAHNIIGRVKQESPFCPDIAATPDGNQVWLTLKDVGKTMVFNARPPFDVIKVIDTGPITNHVNIARNARGQFAYVTVGGLNTVKVFRTDSFEQVAAIPTGALPHGLWPSGDGTRVYVGLENADGAAAIDTLEKKVLDTIAVGQAPQGVAYVPNAVPQGDGTQNLQPLGVAANVVQLTLAGKDSKPATQVTLFDQGLVQMVQAAVTGLPPKQPFVLALSDDPRGGGRLEPLAGFVTNPAGAAIVNTIGSIRQVTQSTGTTPKRYLVIAAGTPAQLGEPVQVQTQE